MVNKITTPPTTSELISKVNELVDDKQDKLTVGAGIDITSDVISNAGVRSVATGASNGTISVNTNGTSAEVSVYGLGSAAYTASTDYATAAQGAKADTAVQPSDLANYVTTNTDQNITGIKTFVGEKRIQLKQSSSGNKLGFTLYDNNNKEAAAFEYKPNVINGYPLMYLGQYKGSGTSYISTPIYVGFRCRDTSYNASYNLVAPLAKDAKSSFSLNEVYKTFYLPLGVTDGNTTVVADSTGVANISTLLPTIPTVDQTYDATSANAQSGVAVASAIDTVLATLYPVGSLYIGTQSTCPLATLISGSTWELVATDKALWGGDGTNANTTIAAGLPNITGYSRGNCNIGNPNDNGGAIKTSHLSTTAFYGSNTSQWADSFDFDASRSSSVYGNSTTVQPPAYRVNIWRRTA